MLSLSAHQFSLAGISNKKTKFYHVISQLDHQFASEVEDIITYLQKDPYTKLRTEVVYRLAPSKEQSILHQLLTLKEMRDLKLSQFLKHLRSLVPDMPNAFFPSI
jgi:hypothetical protein